MARKVDTINLARKFMVHHSTYDYCLCSTDNIIYKYCYSNKVLSEIFRLPPRNLGFIGKIKDYIARSRLYRCFSDNIGVGHVTLLPSGTIISLYGSLYRYDGRKRLAEKTFDYNKYGIKSPLKGGIAVHPESGNAYFGEYINDKVSSIGIYCISDDGRKMHCCYKFESDEIKHVHGIFWDEYRHRLWVTTGDKDHESNLYYTDDEFDTLIKFSGGDQSWRMVSATFTKDYIYWGMDAGKDAPPDSKNKIYRMNVETKKRETLAEIDKPAYHIIKSCSGKMYLGTTYEIGMPNNPTKTADLWFSENGDVWDKIESLNFKPSNRKGCTKYAHLFFPTGILPDNEILITPVNTSKYDFTLLSIK
ncbi:hypothetical protein MHO82_00495 [Vibrio sp. Of7-15]|uniref:hypothetical protein n=1 Tax=Vibrio sp. Of7-15 TaxID=2724879 RepID=UPI001EF2A87D|nr:hypothetical protein [Vibrio sp. Of7-15]MCG7495336.1 hypothetical protein [Vibrio sp. Of7-15]